MNNVIDNFNVSDDDHQLNEEKQKHKLPDM